MCYNIYMKRISYLKIAAFLLAALIFASCAPQKYTAENYLLFDTDAQIVGYDNGKYAFDAESDEIFDMLSEYDKFFDIYNEYSDRTNLKTVNDSAGIGPVSVAPCVIELLEFAKEVYDLTGGKVNVAMGSVLKIWHGFREGDGPVPDRAELEEAAKHTDINSIVIDNENGTVFITDPLCSIDVGAVAKGWACEKAAKKAEKDGKTAYGFSLGGNVRVTGEKPDGQWEIGIRNPEDEAGGSVESVTLSRGAVVTSGNYIRYREVDGVRYHHIIDPDTLFPSDRYLSVTVVYPDSGVADTLSTALFNMSEEEGRALAASLGDCRVIWIYPDMTVSDTK